MTYCVAMNVDEGLVGLADSLVTSGREKTTQRKVSVYSPPEGGTFFVMTSGLRSVRDKTLTYLEEALADHDPPLERLYQAVNLLAVQVRRVAQEDKASLAEERHAVTSTPCRGRWTRDPRQKLYSSPEGNWVDTGDPTPYHTIGSTGYGKPILDRVLKSEDSLRHAFKVACVSFDSTRISAADVDFPIDVVLYRRGSFRIVERRFEKQDLERLSQWWDARVRRAIEETPGEWFDRAFDEIHEPTRPKAAALRRDHHPVPPTRTHVRRARFLWNAVTGLRPAPAGPCALVDFALDIEPEKRRSAEPRLTASGDPCLVRRADRETGRADPRHRRDARHRSVRFLAVGADRSLPLRLSRRPRAPLRPCRSAPRAAPVRAGAARTSPEAHSPLAFRSIWRGACTRRSRSSAADGPPLPPHERRATGEAPPGTSLVLSSSAAARWGSRALRKRLCAYGQRNPNELHAGRAT